MVTRTHLTPRGLSAEEFEEAHFLMEEIAAGLKDAALRLDKTENKPSNLGMAPALCLAVEIIKARKAAI